MIILSAIFPCNFIWILIFLQTETKYSSDGSSGKITSGPFWEELYDEMMAQINSIWSGEVNKVNGAKRSIECCKTVIQKLRQIILSQDFKTSNDEIEFFKTVKPKFHSYILFYLKVYNIELNRPAGSKSDQSEYLSKEFYKLRLFFESHTAFYHYYRSGETFLDDQYFRRHKNATARGGVQFLYIDADPNFSTIYDYQVAKILANQLLSDYLNDELSAIQLQVVPEGTAVKPVLSWSDSKVALAELLYALYATGIFNNTQADIKTISAYFCGMFNVKIGNIYKVFEEIRLRKKNRTAFIDSLRQNLIQRMDRDDEQAF